MCKYKSGGIHVKSFKKVHLGDGSDVIVSLIVIKCCFVKKSDLIKYPKLVGLCNNVDEQVIYCQRKLM